MAVLQQTGDLLLGGTVEYRGGQTGFLRNINEANLAQTLSPIALGLGDIPAGVSDPAQVHLKNLPDVHSGGYTQRVEDDVDRGAVRQERHVLDR